MTVRPDELLEAAELEIWNTVGWGRRPPTSGSGVYVVTMPVPLQVAPLNHTAIDEWLRRLPQLTLDGARPTTKELADYLSRWWLPTEVVLYVGKATRLGSRLGQYYDTELGARGPHAGGAWLKTLSNLADLTVTWSADRLPGDSEGKLLEAFGIHAPTPTNYPDPDLTLPFANLEIVRNGRRQRRRHLLRGGRAQS